MKSGDLSFDILKTVRQFVTGYELEQCPLWLWEDAICKGSLPFVSCVGTAAPAFASTWNEGASLLENCRVTPKSFVAKLAEVRLPGVFNPYVERCELHDRADAVRLRKKNLETFLEAALDNRIETIWVARDLGYRGGRRTGVPLTDEVHLAAMGRLLGGVERHRATRGPVVAERTAAVVWKVLSRIEQPVVLWNVFPFHPHDLTIHFQIGAILPRSVNLRCRFSKYSLECSGRRS